MGATLTEVQLKKHMPKLCKRLNADALLVSLSGELGDVDEEIVRKKIEKSCTESNGTIILYMYKALKRTLGDDHVDCFLRAVQEQFQDLGQLGIKVEAPENKEKVSRRPSREQPDATRAATGPRPCQPRSAEQHQHGSLHVFPYSPGHRHQDPSPFVAAGPPHPMYSDPFLSCKSTFTTSDFHSFEAQRNFQSAGWGSGVQRETREAETVLPPMSRSSVPCADRDRTRQYPEQSEITMSDLINNMSGMKVTDSLQRHPQERAAHPCEPTTERRAPYPNTSNGSARSGNPSVPEVAEVSNAGNDAFPCAGMRLNILTSVEDNTANGTAFADEVEGGEGSPPLAANPSDLTNRPDRKIGNQPGPTPDAFNHGNVQTDGELPTHDLQPEQPEYLVENSEYDQWASDAPQSTISPVRAVEETARPTTVIYNIAKFIVPGEGNYVGLGGDMIIKTVHKPARQQKEYTPHRRREEECSALPQAVSSSIVDHSEDTTAKLPITYLNPNDPRHCQQIAQSVESLCLPHRGREEERSALPQAVSSSIVDQSEDTTAKLPITYLNPNDPRHCQQRAQSVESLRLPDLSIFRSSDSHHDTKPKVVAENQAEKVVTTSNFNESDESSKPSQIQDQEIGTEQNPNQPACGFSKPGILLGPLELQMLEEQRNASIEIPSGVVLSPEASRSS